MAVLAIDRPVSCVDRDRRPCRLRGGVHHHDVDPDPGRSHSTASQAATDAGRALHTAGSRCQIRVRVGVTVRSLFTDAYIRTLYQVQVVCGDMDRVLQRVGLVKRTGTAASPAADCSASSDPRRRRAKTRRRSATTAPAASNNSMTKTSGGGGLFNIDWDYVRECKSCKSRALLGRRFCYKKCDNALYRSNSFKFERFERSSGTTDTTVLDPTTAATCTLSKQIALCDHYSLPADDLCKPDSPLQHVSARSLAPSGSGPALSDWNISSSNEEKVDILETYSTPKDNRVVKIQQPQLQKHNASDLKYFTSPEREYSQPYTTDKSSEPVSDDDFFGCPDQSTLCKLSDLNSPDSISEALPSSNLLQTPVKAIPRKQPSPYYYSDLLNKPSDAGKTVVASTLSEANRSKATSKSLQCYKKRSTLDATHSSSHDSHVQGQKAAASYHKKYRRSLPPEDRLYQASSKLYSRTAKERSHKRPLFIQHGTDDQSTKLAGPVLPALLAPCSYLPSEDVLLSDDDEDDMNRQRRHVYETAFDSRISKSDDDLDQIDRVSNHPILTQFAHNKQLKQPPTSQHQPISHKLSSYSLGRRKLRQSDSKAETFNALSEKLQEIQIHDIQTASEQVRGYSTSPPLTAPLPVKFLDKDFIMNSIRSTPNLPLHSRGCYRDNTVTLPTKLFSTGRRAQSNALEINVPTRSKNNTTAIANPAKEKSPNSSNSAFEMPFPETSKGPGGGSGRPKTSLGVFPLPRENIKEIKDRPKKKHNLLPMKHRSKERKGVGIEYKGHIRSHTRKHTYSSTESMTTVSNSSDGSMESIKSSTSEGNRSTTSTESRHSCSISSHDSDSGALSGAINSFLLAQPSTQSQVKNLHILSPISDKSSQEPFSETSDNNRNNNAHKSPVEAAICADDMVSVSAMAVAAKARRRVAQNKNLLNLGFKHKDNHDAAQGSDSGISIQSREGMQSKFGLDLLLAIRPADSIAKVRTADFVCTSDSATSIDFGELPFDMPKLRRRLRVQQSSSNDISISQASSSQSVAEGHRQFAAPRPKLSLNLCEVGSGSRRPASGLGLALTGFNPPGTLQSPQDRNIVDVGVPLEKQAWFHGAITRIEAENVLRPLEEGSFLVRNSESTKQDYSLSLKSARGYMHMRIQRSETEVNGLKSFILGQFSKPFNSIPEMIRHFSLNGLPIRGAEHMCLIQPVIAQLL